MSYEGHSAAQRERTQGVSHHLVDFSQPGSFHELVHTLMAQVYFYLLSSLVQVDLLGSQPFYFWPQRFPQEPKNLGLSPLDFSSENYHEVYSTSCFQTHHFCFPLTDLSSRAQAPLPREKLKVPLDLLPWKRQLQVFFTQLEPKVAECLRVHN